MRLENKLMLTIVVAICSCASLFADCTFTKAFEEVRTSMQKENQSARFVPSVSIYEKSNDAFVNPFVTTVLGDTVVVDTSKWVFFCKDNPLSEWCLDGKYIEVDKKSCQQALVSVASQPLNSRFWSEIGIGNANDYISTDELCSVPSGVWDKLFYEKSENYSPKKFAIIINGGYNPENNYYRYWNNTCLFYQYLTQIEGLPSENIYVCFGSGGLESNDLKLVQHGFQFYEENGKLYFQKVTTVDKSIDSNLDLDFDGINDIKFASTKKNISYIFDELSHRMTKDDELIVYTTDHGTPNALCLWRELMTPSEFKLELDKVATKKIYLLMLQCYSGQFINPLKDISKIEICTATQSFETASSYDDYGIFGYYFVSALAQQDICGNFIPSDRDGDGKVTFEEAFNYAFEPTINIVDETPQIFISDKEQPTDISNITNNIAFYANNSILTLPSQY